jgi:hypothetical protein
MPTPVLTVADLTGATLDGVGVFDVLMRANKAHLDAEYGKNRIKGAEYATVYLGSLEPVLRASLEFLLQKDKSNLESQLLEQQIILAGIEVQKANAQLLQIAAQTAMIEKQTLNLITENLLNEAKAVLTNNQAANAVIEGTVLVATECKIRAEFDLVTANTAKATSEIALLAQKTETEKAQITALGVDMDSVIGRQKALYAAQTNGFTRDAEQKAAKLMVDSWNTRRMTDEGTIADNTNKLSDANVGAAVTKLLTGIGA